MAVSKRTRCWTMARGSLAALMLAVSVFAADRAGADIIKKEDTLRGITMTRAQCFALQQAVWLRVDGQDFCVRYYLSTAGGEGARPVVFWNGDANGLLNVTQDRRTGNILRRTWVDPSRAQDVNTDNLMAFADGLSKMTKTTAIYMGRIGVDGTSGNHVFRKTLVELHLMSAALNAIKQRYRFEGFNLMGESGGARFAFALAAIRPDVGCVVSGSGQLGPEEGGGKKGDPWQTFFDVMGSAPRLAQNHATRLMMVTDPADQQVPPATEQNPMVVKLRQAGRVIPQFFVQSNAANHHDVFEYTRLVMAGCVLRKTDAEIAQATKTIMRRDAEIKQRAQDEAKLRTKGKAAHLSR